MPVPDTAVSTRPNDVPCVRSAAPADHLAIRDVVIAAYRPAPAKHAALLRQHMR